MLSLVLPVLRLVVDTPVAERDAVAGPILGLEGEGRPDTQESPLKKIKKNTFSLITRCCGLDFDGLNSGTITKE